MKAALAALIAAAVITLVLGPLIIPLLRILKFGQTVRADGPRAHFQKSGTPTMGGIIFLAAITVVTLFWGQGSLEAYIALAITVGYGLIGFADDFIKIAMRRSLGLKARYKLTGQILLGLILGFLAVLVLNRGTEVVLPFTELGFQLGWFYPFFVLLVLVAATNAVNLTDGLDGLAAGITLFAALAYVLIAVWLDRGGLAAFAASVAGGCLGFLFFNRYPASVFMGDTGSLALGAALGSMAVLTGTELLLPFIGGVYVLETLSVIIQVISFRATGKRVFRMSPVHHHFELIGWPETKVVKVFWFWGLSFAVLGILGFLNLG